MLLQIEDLHLEIEQLGTRLSVLHGVDLTVNAGESVALVGETGSGKTLTAMSTLRLLPAGARVTQGRVLLDDCDVLTASAETVNRIRGRTIGTIFQQARAALNPTRPIRQQVADRYMDLAGASRRQALRQAQTLLGQVGLPEPQTRGNHYPHQLSGGMCQRVMIALAIAAGPRLLLADEPTTGLDVTLQAQILALLTTLVNEQQMGMLLITHDLAVVAQSTQRIYVMYAGEVVEAGPTQVVLAQPQHPYTQGLVNAVSSLEAGQRPVAIPGLVPRFQQSPSFCPFASRCPHVVERCCQERPAMRSMNVSHSPAAQPTNQAQNGVHKAACHLLADGPATGCREDAGETAHA